MLGRGCRPSLATLPSGYAVVVSDLKLVWNLMGDEVWHSWAFRGRKRRPRAWDVAPLAIIWVSWKEGNMRVFEGVVSDFVKLWSSLLFLILFWGIHEALSCS